MSKRYLILHLNSNGDLLFATAIAKQLKEIDDPGCHITWAVATPFKNILLQNPYIDTLLEVPAENYLDIKNRAFRQIEADVKIRMEKGEWDTVICPQLMYENMWRYTGTIRRAVLRSYPGTIQDITPVLRLSEKEVTNVSAFAGEYSLESYKHRILFECSPLSGQSSVTPSFAIAVAESVIKKFPDAAFILSSNKKIKSTLPNIIDGSRLSFRENAELTKYCTHLIGCSSGITWISLSDWAKKLSMLQLSSTGINPVSRDFQREGLDTSHLIEMYQFNQSSVVECISLMLNEHYGEAKAKFNQNVPPDINFIEGILLYLINHRHFKKAWAFLKGNMIENSFHHSLFLMLAKLPVTLPFKLFEKIKKSKD